MYVPRAQAESFAWVVPLASQLTHLDISTKSSGDAITLRGEFFFSSAYVASLFPFTHSRTHTHPPTFSHFLAAKFAEWAVLKERRQKLWLDVQLLWLPDSGD